MSEADAVLIERDGPVTIVSSATRFASGVGRHGAFGEKSGNR
jgi:hypothetical protein